VRDFDDERRRLDERARLINTVGAMVWAAAITSAAIDGRLLQGLAITAGSLLVTWLIERWIWHR